MSRRRPKPKLPPVLYEPIPRGKSSGDVAKMLNERLRLLLTAIGVAPSSMLYDAKSESMIDGLLRDQRSARYVFCWLLEEVLPGFRVISNISKPPRDNIALYRRFEEIRQTMPRASKAAVAKRMLDLKQKRKCPELRGLNSEKAILRDVRQGGRDYHAWIMWLSERRKLTSLLSVS